MCTSSLGNNFSDLNKLKRLQNKAIRIIIKNSFKHGISQHYCRLQILKLDKLYKFVVAKLISVYSQKDNR